MASWRSSRRCLMSWHIRRMLAVVIAAAVCAAAPGCATSATSTSAGSAATATEPAATVVYTLERPEHRNPAGIVWDAASRSFFVGAYNDGTLYRGQLDSPTVPVYLEGRPGQTAVGLK